VSHQPGTGPPGQQLQRARQVRRRHQRVSPDQLPSRRLSWRRYSSAGRPCIPTSTTRTPRSIEASASSRPAALPVASYASPAAGRGRSSYARPAAATPRQHSVRLPGRGAPRMHHRRPAQLREALMSWEADGQVASLLSSQGRTTWTTRLPRLVEAQGLTLLTQLAGAVRPSGRWRVATAQKISSATT
jgi:hypothetical protein